MEQMRIVIADDHTVIRRGVELMLQAHGGFNVVATAANGEEAYQAAKKHQPDIVLMDISMPPGDNGIVTAARIHNEFPEIKIVIMTMHDEKALFMYTMKENIQGYILKNISETEIVRALEIVYNGGVFISPEFVGYLLAGYRHPDMEENKRTNLTEKEMQILILVAKGYGNKEIGSRMHLSVKTVESYKAKVMSKLGIKTRPEMVEYALRNKFLDI